VYDPVGRPHISRDCKHSVKPDWIILKMAGPPPPGWKAGDYKEYLKHKSPEDIEANVPNRLPDGNGRPKRQKKTPTTPIAVAPQDDSVASPQRKKHKKDPTSKGSGIAKEKGASTTNPAANAPDSPKLPVGSQIPILARQVFIHIYFIFTIYYIYSILFNGGW